MEDLRTPLSVAVVAVAVAAAWAGWQVFSRPVSYPGDARPNRLKPRGRWHNKETQLSAGWKFAVAEESHRVSTNATGVALTGDPAGRQIWYKDDSVGPNTSHTPSFNPSVNPNSADKLLRSILLEQWKGPRPDPNTKPATAKDAARKGMQFYQMIQCSDGHWASDYGGPLFLMPGLITVIYLTKIPFAQYKKDEMVKYILNHQQADGGWGLHIEGPSTMFGSVLNYVALRLLGVNAEEDFMITAREFIHEHGGALYTSSWAKFWLAVLGIYDWAGINSVPCEMWYLPRWFPFHPGKLWCHCRMVYLPMCYIYGKRFSADVASDSVLQSLRREIYCEPYESINWDSHRFSIAEIDNYSPIHWIMRAACNILSVYEARPWLWDLFGLRKMGLEFAISYIMEEDKQTNFVDIGPVNKSLNMLAVWVHSGCDNKAERFQPHVPRIDDYLYVAEDGMKMAGYNGSQCWDTSFTAQALVEMNLASEFKECSIKIHKYLDLTQIKTNENNREYWFRQLSKGGWPFSTPAHGWPISDCTSEGLKAVLALQNMPWLTEAVSIISPERLFDAVEVILSLHNADGGWATYENNRGYGWYELLNPSEVFGDIMIDYSYVECTSACVTALKKFTKFYPTYKREKIESAITAGRRFLKSIQRPDGSWYGSWGCCFTYGTWFGIEGLVVAGEPTSSPAVQKAVQFLLGKQNPNGGWGEAFVACVDKAYPEGGSEKYGADKSGVVQTAWALLGLMAAGCKDRTAIDRGIQHLMQMQLPNGDWEQEGITGVFNRSCGISYSQYRNIFPIWALGRYGSMYQMDDLALDTPVRQDK